jgi:hypothetical protein
MTSQESGNSSVILSISGSNSHVYELEVSLFQCNEKQQILKESDFDILHIGTLGFWTFACCQHCQHNATFWKLDPFPPSGRKVRRQLLI